MSEYQPLSSVRELDVLDDDDCMAERWRLVEPHLGVSCHVENHNDTYDSEVFLSLSVPGRKSYANPTEAVDAAIAAAKGKENA